MRSRRGNLSTHLILSAAALALLPVATAFAQTESGARLYAERCASCHGAKGEGSSEGVSDPLIGDRPLKDLARVIDETMPEGEPETLSAEESAQIATYIYDAFYSPAAQIRNAPPRVELARLTVGQYQNTVTDLVASFGRSGREGRPGRSRGDADGRGLNGEYFRSRVCANRDRMLERIDPTINFDFGEGSPDLEKIKPEEFAASWRGSVFAPETGEYEFIVETPNGMRFWINDPQKPAIDVTVRADDDREHRVTRHLLGGRSYPIRLEMHKSTRDKTALVRLKWKRPGQAEEVVPERCLSPGRSPKLLVVETPFPPDDRSGGYERGTSISKEWDAATTFAAIEVAGKILTDLDGLADTRRDAPDRPERLRDFSRRFVERAFRRPVPPETLAAYVDRQFDEAPDPATAVKRIVLLTLKSPRFLYREVGSSQPDAYDVASRLSFGLWDSLPDDELLDAAANGRLATPEQVRAQAERMIDDLRTRAKLLGFFRRWLQFERFADLSKDPTLYPEFDPAVASDLRTSLELFLDEVVWAGDGDYRRLMLDDSVYLNGRLAKLYSIDLPPEAGFQKVSLNPDQRAGLLTHPYLLTGFAYHATTSPIHRGVFISRSLLGRGLKPPPEAVSPVPPDLHPGLTTRERTILQTDLANCRSCHDMINPLGFTLEHFDAIGRFRETEKDKPIDDAGSYLTQSGEEVRFDGAKELATFLASSDEAHEAFTEQLFNHFIKQPVGAYGPDRLSDLRRSFAEGDFDVRELLAEIAATSAGFDLERSTPVEAPVPK